MSTVEIFAREALPTLVEGGHLVVLAPEGRLPILYSHHAGVLARLTGPGREGSLVALLQQRGASGVVLNAGAVLSESPGLLLDFPAAAQYTARDIYYAPALLWDETVGRYVSPPHGWCPGLRTFSLAEQYQPRPVDDSPLTTLFDRLRLGPGNRAKLVAFLAGCLVRSSYGPMPALMLRSPYKGTGKSTIAKLAAHLATGADSVSPLIWSGDTELRKTVAEAAGGVFWFDNISIDSVGSRSPVLRSPLLNAATQSGSVRARVLGESRTAALHRPVFILTMQGGMVDPDLVDRFLYVLLPDPPPADITPASDILPLVADRWRGIRDELAQLILRTRPLEGHPRPNPGRHYRFTDFYRHVAPVVTSAGLDPSAVADDAGGEANAIHVELAALLAGQAQPVSVEVLARQAAADPYRSPVLTSALPYETGARLATLKYYLKSLPSTIRGMGYSYKLTLAGDRYSAALEEV